MQQQQKEHIDLIKSSLKVTFFVLLFIWAFVPFVFVLQTGESWLHVIPYMSLFTGFRGLSKTLWVVFGTPLNTNVRYEPLLIPSMDAKDYSPASLQRLTNDWTKPAVVRGLFLNTTACRKWRNPGHLAQSNLAHHVVSVVRQAYYGQAQTNRSFIKFQDAINDVMGEDAEHSYLLFPMMNRLKPTAEYNELKTATDKLVADEMEIGNVIWNGFGNSKHTSYKGTQLLFAKGLPSLSRTTGTGWHNALPNNFFVQVVGKKRWYFMDPKYTYMFKPLRVGWVSFMTSITNLDQFRDNMPIEYADINEGDMLYNPAWYWHAIENYEGLSFGAPIRELNLTQSFAQSFLLSAISVSNRAFLQAGFDIGGYAPKTMVGILLQKQAR